MPRAFLLPGRLLPKGLLDAMRQLLLCAIAYELYRLVRGLADTQARLAFIHARGIADFERSIGLFFEPRLQHLALNQSWVLDAANWCYANSQFSITPVFLIWLYFARNEAFYYVRNMFMIAMGIALIGYTIFPTAPPRLLPEWGFTDTVSNMLGQSGSNAASLFYNPYAAVPSMHMAFALMISVPAVRLMTRRIFKVLWALYPVLILVVVMVTANHFWIDTIFGALVAALAAYTAQATLGRARPEAWGWRSALSAKATA